MSFGIVYLFAYTAYSQRGRSFFVFGSKKAKKSRNHDEGGLGL